MSFILNADVFVKVLFSISLVLFLIVLSIKFYDRFLYGKKIKFKSFAKSHYKENVAGGSWVSDENTGVVTENQTVKRNDLSFRERQIDAVVKGHVYKKPIMNKSEYRLYKSLSNISNEIERTLNQKVYVFPQVSLGEIIGGDPEAFKAINIKRTDFVIVDARGFPLALIEYHGEGHYGNDNDKRNEVIMNDQVKKIVCDKIGIGYIKVIPDYDESDLGRDLSIIIGYKSQQKY